MIQDLNRHAVGSLATQLKVHKIPSQDTLKVFVNGHDPDGLANFLNFLKED